MAMKSLNDLFVHFLRDIYYAEKQGLKQMRSLARKVENEELKAALEAHREETEHQVERLTGVFESLEMRARGVTCEAMVGLIEEAKEIAEEAADGPTRDAGIIAAIQAVEHYEITRYGTLVAWANALGHADAAKLLSEILEEEKATDAKLSELFMSLMEGHAYADDEAIDEAADEDEAVSETAESAETKDAFVEGDEASEGEPLTQDADEAAAMEDDEEATEAEVVELAEKRRAPRGGKGRAKKAA